MSIMKAVVLDAPGPPEALQIRDVPVPTPRQGQVLIKVVAFGLNRSELHTRLGLAEGVTFPRILGIEATGTVAACPGGEFGVGQQVATMMGGMGRTFDGGYAEYTCVPADQVVPFSSNLDWATLGRDSGDAANGVRLLDDRPRRPTRSVDLDSRRHILGGYGDGRPRQTPQHDRVVNDSESQQDRSADQDRC